jgi:primosomal protein N' (replication factor Y) (superfamily II helicase)
VKHCILKVALDTPLDQCFDYRWCGDAAALEPQVGHLVLVPFGTRQETGLVVAIAENSDVPQEKLREVLALRVQLAPLSNEWRALCTFAADYYQRPFGEVALPGMPKGLRSIKTTALDKALKKLDSKGERTHAHAVGAPSLNPEQVATVDAIAAARGFVPMLLYGVTGSGKTEVYLRAAEEVLARAAQAGKIAQVLILVPEINLTPQLEQSVRARFPFVFVATLHSGLSEGERLRNWLAAHLGHARIVLGTRLAILASLPHLQLLIIDEEHDPSYKQQEGLRYSARDLAVWRARQLGIPIVLGSATPSLESWQHAQTGRYGKLELRNRASQDAVLPKVHLIDMGRDRPVEGLSKSLVAALKSRLERGEQSLLFLNRRGYAPVLSCDACGWISNCTCCTAFMVLHKPERRLRCHHCSMELRIPRACPTCGNVDLQPIGRGTQRVEEGLQQQFPQARIVRIDADSTRRKGSAQAAFDSVHRGEVDILIGTQMVAKGHDFRNLTLVGVLNPDTALFSHDYRASERLFAQLMQVAGRAGRAAQKEGGSASEVLIQTRYPHHPLYSALLTHDYEQFAADLLKEREQAGLPPFLYQALLRAEAPQLQTALAFLQDAAACIAHPGITINDPIPMSLTRVANVERAQLLIESASRPALQAFLKEWMRVLRAEKTRTKWSLEVDPMDI